MDELDTKNPVGIFMAKHFGSLITLISVAIMAYYSVMSSKATIDKIDKWQQRMEVDYELHKTKNAMDINNIVRELNKHWQTDIEQYTKPGRERTRGEMQ